MKQAFQMVIAALLGLALAGPAVAQQGDPAQLPAGHPPMGAGAADFDGHGHDRAPDSVLGTLMIKAVQGTPGGENPANLDFKMHLVHSGRPLKHVTGKLDENGVAMVEDLPVGIGAQAEVELAFKGVPYRFVSDVMDPEQPDSILRATVYELADSEPPWKILVHHATVRPVPGKNVYLVQERLVLENPTDRVWVGPADSHGQRVVFTLPLSPGADEQTSVEYASPLHPGRQQFPVNYTVPVRDNKATIRLTAVRATPAIAIIKEDERNATEEAIGLRPGDPMQTEQKTPLSTWQATNLAPGESVSLVITRIPPSRPSGKVSMNNLVLAIGGGGLLLVGLGIIWFRTGRKKSENRK